MLRALLVAAALAAAASGHKNFNNYYGLGSLLPQPQIQPAIQLIEARYPGISGPAAATIVRITISSPVQPYLSGLAGFGSVPSLVSGRRLAYLQAYLSGFPGSPFYGSYTSPLLSYLSSMGIVGISSPQLIDSLALTDVYASAYRVRPVSPALFNQFYFNYLLGQSGPVAGFSLPQLSYFVPRLQSYSFPGQYFQPIGGGSISIPSVGGPVIIPSGGGVIPGSPGGIYSGPGSDFLSVYPAVGLPYPLQPAATLGGLSSFISARQISFPSYVASIRSSRALPGLVRAVPFGRYRSYLRRFRFLNEGLLTRDIVPLIGSRYVSFPDTVRGNFYVGSQSLDFNGLLSGYFGSSYFSRLGRRHRSYSRRFVGDILSGFDQYCRRRPIARLSKYKGPWWLTKLYSKSHKLYKKGHLGHLKKWHKG